MRREENLLIRGVVKTPSMRFALAEADDLCNTVIVRHDADPAAGAILAEAATAAALLAVLLDPDEKFSIRWSYEGSLRGVLAEVHANGAVRALVNNPHVLDNAGVGADEILGVEGCTVAVTRSCGGKVRNSGEVKTAFLNPAPALAYFLSTSDQVETEIAVDLQWTADPARPVKAADAVMLQALPGCDLPEFETVRNRLETPEARHWLSADVAASEKIKRLIDACVDAEEAPELTIHPMEAPHFQCNCSPERMQQMLKVLSAEELESLFAENPHPTVRCNFCNAVYTVKHP